MAEDQLRSTESISKEKALLFDWLQEKSSVPYYQQGNRKFESAGMMEQRNKVKYTSEVRAAINRFWELLNKNNEGRIEKAPYCDLCLRFSKLLIPDFSKEEILAVVEEDWINDSEGEGSLSYSQFYNALFQLADVWTEEISPAGYSDFLMKIYRRITCKKTLLPNGEIREDLPCIQLVFPDELKREADWEGADSQEEYDDDYEYKYNILENGEKTREKRLKMTDLLVDTGGVHYDEVILPQWEQTGKGESIQLAEMENIVPLGHIAEDYLKSLSKKPSPDFKEVTFLQSQTQTGDKIVVLSEVTKHKIKQQSGSSFVTLKKSTIKVDGNASSIAIPNARKNVHDFSMSLLKSENKGNPIAIERPEIQTIQDMRKTQLQNKYQPIVKRVERKVSMQAKKGMLEIDKSGRKVHVEEPEVFYPPVESLKGLYSAEKEIPKDPYTNREDIIVAASQEVVKIVIMGPPRSGKSMLAQEICKSLDLHHVELQSIVERLLAKGKKEDEEEEAEDEEEGQKKPEIYTDFEKSIISTLTNGESLSIPQCIELFNIELLSPLSLSKGFVLDIPLQYSYFELLKTQTFNLFITLKFSLSDLTLQTTGLKWDPASNLTYSSWHIYELTKPVVKKEEDEEAEEEEKPRLPVETFLKCAQDFQENIISAASQYFDSVEPRLTQIPADLPESLKLEIKAPGLTPEALTKIVLAKLGHRVEKPPASKKLEGDSNPKGLLLQNIEEGQEPRAFSIWKQIDPVALLNSILVQGKPEYAAEYAGNVFLFDNEENQEKFVRNPQMYLRTPPKMPKEFRLCIVGPKRSGKHTQAEYLCAKYGWKLIDVPEMLKMSLQTQKKHSKDPLPSHPDTGLVQLPDPEFRTILSGESVPGQNILPIILNKLGIPLMKKPPPPPTPKSEEEVEQGEAPEEVKESGGDSKSEEEKDKEDSEENEEKPETEPKIPSEEKLNTEENVEKLPTPPPEPIVYDDLPLTEIVLKKDESGKTVKLQGFIMLGYPNSEEEANSLKEFGVEFDKIIYLVDPNDGEILIKRGAEQFVDLAKEIAFAEQGASVCRDAFGEENVIEIKIDGTETEVHDRILKALDPFYLEIEDPENIVSKEEAGEEAVVTTASEYSNYDPVVLKEHEWLMPGSEEFEVQSLGKRYLFVSELEMEKFKKSPKDYIESAPIPVPQPHIFVTGPRGSGVQTIISELCGKFQVPDFYLKPQILRYLDEERIKRRKSRLLKRGFVPKEQNEDDEPYDPLLHDPEIAEEDETFDRAVHERQALQHILPAAEPLVINGKWFDVDEEKVSQPLVDLMFESRRLPEIVLILRANEKTTLERLLDKEGITKKYEELMEIRRKEKEKVREEARKEKIQARLDKIAAGEEVEDEEEVEEEEEGDDPDAPNLESMLDDAKQKLIEIRDADNSAVDELKEAFEGKNIKVVEVPTEGSLQRLLQKINHEISPVFINRSTLLEKNLPVKLNPTKAQELLIKNKAKISCFGKLCPITPELPTSRKYPVLFRDRIYYPGSEIDQKKLIDAPWMYLSQDTQPKDVDLNVFASIIGGPGCGKTTLAKDLEKEIDVVRISLRLAVSQVLAIDSELAHRVKDQLGSGQALSDHLAVEVIAWRVGLADVLEKGCVLDGFPKSASQAIALANRNLLPNPVLFVSCDKFDLVKRLKSKFKHDEAALKIQMTSGQTNLLEVASWYQNTYNNLRYLSSNYSKWWVKDSAVSSINSVFTSKRNYAIALIKGIPVRIKNLPITRYEIGKRFGKFKRYDPVIWKYKGDLVDVKSDEFLVEYKTKLFAFKDQETLKIFMQNPESIIQSKRLPDHLPRKLVLAECGDIYESRIEYESNCVVTLAEEGALVKGNPTLLVSFSEKVFCFKNVAQREKFMKRPQKYEKTKLPVKIPPKPDNLVNFILEEFETSVGFLDQMLGQVIIKALLEVGTQKLMFPSLSVKETALKHFALFLKAWNPANTGYQKEKYSKKLWDFKQKCLVQRELYEDGVRKENNELKRWQIENYFEKGEQYSEFIQELNKNVNGYIDKYFR